MAPSHSKPVGQNGNESKAKEVLLPLVPVPQDDELNGTNSVQFTLYSTPTDQTSPSYKVTCRILMGGEDIRTVLQCA